MNRQKHIWYLYALILVLAGVIQYEQSRLVALRREYRKELANVQEIIRKIVLGGGVDNNDQEFSDFMENQQGLVFRSRKLNRLEDAWAHDHQLLLQILKLKNSSVHVFHGQNEERYIDDTYIEDCITSIDRSMGLSPLLGIGVAPNERKICSPRRALIRFDNLGASIPANAKILSGALYFKQARHNNQSGVLNETIDLYKVRKDWNEGQTKYGLAQKGECTWKAARFQELEWEVPGLWGGKSDVDNTVLATAQHVEKAQDEKTWISFYFNEDGLKNLEEIIQGKPNYGWLLRIDDDLKNDGLVFFHSSNDSNGADRPYLEIVYYTP